MGKPWGRIDGYDTWSRLRKQSWARLLKKIYEVDPFLSSKCGGAMAVLAVIEDRKELEALTLDRRIK